MKKMIYLFTAVLLSSSVSFAIVDSQYSTSANSLRNMGYSQEAIRIKNLNTKNPYETRTNEQLTPFQYSKSFVKKFFVYIDPAMGSEQFGDSEFQPNNSFRSEL